MAGYNFLKRKGVHDHVLIDDFPLSSPASKIRRLDAELPPIAEVGLDHDEPLPVTMPIAAPEAVEAEAPNEERAIVLFKPPSHSPSPFSITLSPDLISEIKHQVPWSKQRDSDCDRLLKSAAEKEEQDEKNRGMALVPWVPSTSYQFAILHDSNNTELMEAEEELAQGETSMEMDVDVEHTTTSVNSAIEPTSSTLHLNHGGGIAGFAATTTVPDGLHQWNHHQQQQQHCLLPQIPQSTSTPITWSR